MVLFMKKKIPICANGEYQASPQDGGEKGYGTRLVYMCILYSWKICQHQEQKNRGSGYPKSNPLPICYYPTHKPTQQVYANVSL